MLGEFDQSANEDLLRIQKATWGNSVIHPIVVTGSVMFLDSETDFVVGF